MEKDIRFTGFTAVPSDYESTDGELTQSYNMLNEDGALRAVLEPRVCIRFNGDDSVLFIHKSNSFDGDHYIVRNNATSDLYCLLETDIAQDGTFDNGDMGNYHLGTFPNITKVDAVGNTLLVFTADAIHYFLWKDGDYVALGDHLPNVELSFGLRGKPRLWSITKEKWSATPRGFFEIEYNKIDNDKLHDEWDEENKRIITSQVMAKVNKFIAEETIQKGRFAMPFFVRYAVRLYDGSLVCHSAPILMCPSTKKSVVVTHRLFVQGATTNTAKCDIFLMSSILDYQYIGANVDLDNWKDIITSIDIFVSKPIYTHDQSGDCSSFNETDGFDSTFIGAIDFDGYQQLKGVFDEGATIETITRKEDYLLLPMTLNGESLTEASPAGKNSVLGTLYAEWPFKRLYEMYVNPYRNSPSTTIEMPYFNDSEIERKLKGVQNFYLFHSLEPSKLSSVREDIEVDDEYLKSLEAREPMTDDYLTHDNLSASYSMNYNGRLNMAGVKRDLFEGFSHETMFSWCNIMPATFTIISNGVYGIPTLSMSYQKNAANQSLIDVYIKENGVEHVVSSKLTGTTTPFVSVYGNNISYGCYLFYPNVNAYKMVVKTLVTLPQVRPITYEVMLQPHDFLNGAFAVLPFESVRSGALCTFKDFLTPKVAAPVSVPNKLYTSEINNPFYFPVTGINTIGTGEIIGLSTAARALSQGQFGQFPLYAFTTDGVWALEVGASGGFSAKQPITRDVCIAPESITQIDTSVLFATDRGIMQIVGSETQCITDIINGPDFFDIADLPGLASLYKGGLPKIDCTFADYRKGARMAYDYVNQHIIIFRADKAYAYVFSMRSKLWGIMASTLQSTVNSYPEAYAMAGMGNSKQLVDISHSDATHAQGLVVTRPIKLDAASYYKTFEKVFMRGFFPHGQGRVKTILYASEDNIHWKLVNSSVSEAITGIHGSPFHYYRIAAITDLSIGETLTGASVQYVMKYTHKMH